MSLKDRFPSVFPIFDDDSTIRGLLDAFETELETFDTDVESITKSIRLNEATGRNLDFIGDDYGPLGRRRGRDDDAYRQFLRTIVAAFEGRGTKSDVRTAVAAGLRIDPDVDVELLEDFANDEYEVVLYDWSPHQTGTIRELAELADPVAVDRVDPVHNILESGDVVIDAGDTVIADMTRSETGDVVIDAGDTTHSETNTANAFGTDTFDGEDTFS